MQYLKTLRTFLFTGLLFLLATGVALPQDTGEKKGRKSKQVRAAEKKKELQLKKSIKAEKKARKKHRDIQSKKVRKHMKRNDRRYQHVDSYDRRSNLIKRIFPRRRPSSK
jgi:hypothetical protein